jgi:two-component system, NarL family, sensor kinase
MRQIALLIFWRIMILPGIYLHAQDNTGTSFASGFKERKEKALAELKNFTRPDTARVNALIKVLNTAVFLKEREEVLIYLPETLALSRKLKYAKGLASCYLQTAAYYKSASDYSQSLMYYDSALYIADNMRDQNLTALKVRALEQKGTIYYIQENYYTALDYYLETLKYDTAISEKIKSRIYTFITGIYISLNSLEKASEYSQKNIKLVEHDSGIMARNSVYFSYIDICLLKNDLKTATLYLDKMSPVIPDPEEVQVNFGYYLKRGRVAYLEQKYSEAYAFFQETYKYAEEGGHSNSRSVSLYFLANTALKLGYYEAAKNYALQNVALTQKITSKSKRIDALTTLSDYYARTNNKEKSYELLQQAMQLKDSLMNETNIKQLNALGSIYESEKQRKEIALLQHDKQKQAADVKQQATLNKIFVGSIILLLILGYLGYTNFRKGQQLAKNQQTLQKQKIIELEKDKQLLSIDAMLKGQEEERSRIAKDLHDGLGGLLSGTKLSFMNVKETLVLSPENGVLFDKSLSMLDNTIGDLRKVAQNLMPEALVKFGLHEAVRDFCDSIQSSAGIKVLYQELGEKRKLDNTAEVFAYRIIQELVNNAVKHADASQVLVQLTINKDRIRITVEDDGKGFDKQKIRHTKGAGMANINYRVQYFNGAIDTVTSPGNGTSVNIELIA